MRLLLAEDDTDLRDFTVRVLTRAGFDVVAAADGVEALELYRKRGPFDVLLLDEDMPRRKGRAVLASIRSTGDSVPTVFWSGDLVLDAAEREALQVTAVLRKPLGPTALLAALRTAVAAQSQPSADDAVEARSSHDAWSAEESQTPAFS